MTNFSSLAVMMVSLLTTSPCTTNAFLSPKGVQHHRQVNGVLVAPTFVTTARTFSTTSSQLDAMRGIFYRSDTRHPIEEPAAIFANGFTKQNENEQDPVIRFFENENGEEIAPDIHPHSAVCFTKDFYAAAIFPVNDLATDTWVYILDLDASNGQIYNSQQVQWEYVIGKKLLKDKAFDKASEILWTMFGQERAANQVAAGDIVGALRVEQRQFNDGFFAGGRFVCGSYIANTGYKGTKSQGDNVKDVMEGFVGNTFEMPTKDSGIVPRDPVGELE